jgi:hypothetical protein
MPPIEWRWKVIHAQLFCNIHGWANLHTGCSSCRDPGDIISYSFYHLERFGSVRFWAPISYLSIWIPAYNYEMWDLCNYGYIFSRPGLDSCIKGALKHNSSWQQNAIFDVLHSAQDHCYLQYTQPYSDSFYISSRMYSSLPLYFFNSACWQKDLHQRQQIWLHLVD